MQGTIEGRRDIAGGRLSSDRRTVENSTLAGKNFRSLCYSADGAFLLAGGNSRYVCLYDVAEKVSAAGLAGIKASSGCDMV